MDKIKTIKAFRARARRRGYIHCYVQNIGPSVYKVVLDNNVLIQTYVCTLDDIAISFLGKYNFDFIFCEKR